MRIEAGQSVYNVDRIYGDSVAIGGGQQIVNDVNPVTGNGGVIASRVGDVDLGAPEIINREHSLIYSSQDLNVGGALDANGKATGQATSLLNASATIDVVRDARFNVATVTNRNDHFSTERIDTGTVHSQGYRLNSSDQEFKPEDVILYQVDNGSWAPGTDPGFLGDDDKKVLVLPSAQYPFSQFGPPFDWSRTPDSGIQVGFGGNQKPVGAAYFPTSYVTDANGDLQMGPEVFVYQPGDAIWSKLGVQAPTAAPPLPASCGETPTSACQAKFDADTAAYNAWRDTNKPLYDQLNTRINAFNGDFNSRQVKAFFIVNKDTNIQDEKVLTTDPAKILVGRHATFPGDVTNDKSQILVGGDLNIDANRLHNLDYDATRIQTVSGTQDWTFIKSHAFKGDDRRYTTSALDTIVTPVPLKLASAVADRNLGTVGHDGSAPGQGAGVGPIAGAPLSSRPVLKELTLPPGAHLGGAVIRQVTPALAVPNNALFRTHPEPGAHYLIETDPRFTDQRQWLSSDIMLTLLGQDPTNVLKRLGDGFYEARLVADAVMLGTGQRFVGDYTDNEQQYIGLMKAGVSFAQKFQLNVGSELTADQMAALTTDLVWLVEKTVTLPDGSTQRVLVPQVYLMSRVGDLKGDGGLISASNTSIHTAGDVVNTGTISSRNVTLIDAKNIHNNGGTLNGVTLSLDAQEDINSLAGKISGNAVLAYAGRDINLASTTASSTGKAGSGNTVLAGVSSVNADTATLVAGRDLNAKAASLQTTGDLAMGAGRDVNLGTVTVAQTEHYEHDARNKSDLSHSTEIGSQFSAGGNATIVAARDVNTTAAYVNAEGALAVGAGRDINVQAGQASAAVRDEHFTQSNGFLSSSSTHSIDANAHTEALGSTLSGNTVDMKAGRDVTIAGSTVAGTGDVNLAAGNDLTVASAETNSSGYSFKEEKKSGFGATGSGLSYGNRNQKDTTNDRGSQQVGSLIGSTDGSVHMQAGSTLTVKGSDLIARQHVTGIGADVNIEAAQNRQHHDETHEVKQSGFTLGVSGGAIGAAINAGNKISSASKSEDGRASALWGMAAARDVADAAQGMGNPTQGAAVTLSWGTSQSKQTLTQDSTNHNGSRVQAGGTAAFVATGVDANGNQTAGNLNIVGSDIDAKKVALGAKHDVNIVSATDSDESHSTNKSSSASVGVSYGLGPNNAGFGVSASASQAKGNSDNTSASQSNSHVNGSESVTIVSGNDTNILGGTLSGGKVVADVGGNLNLASRQDTGESHARQQSMGGGFSISQGGGSASFSASKGKADGSYANVAEQSGIYAGEGGFDLNVKGNTDLKGAVIASEASQDKNSLTTGTLTWSDIANHSDYSATSMGVSGGGTMGSPNIDNKSGPTSGKNTGGISPMIPQHKSGSEDGVAQAAVADGTITIQDEANQKQDLATLKRDTTGANSQVGSNPDLKNVLDKQSDMMAAAQAAGEAVAKTVGQVANAKQAEAQDRYKAAAEAYQRDPSAENQAAMAVAQSDIEGWKEGGEYRAALHTAGGALVAGMGGGSAIAGAAGAGAASLAGGKLNELGNAVAGNAGTGNADLNEAIGNLAANIVAGGIGAVVGGSSGAVTAANTDRYNRQLNDQERKWAKDNAADFAKYYERETGKAISVAEAQKMLLANGYRIVDDMASKGPGGDATARGYISANATGHLFKATPAERTNPGKMGSGLTPEQASMPANSANPQLGMAAGAGLGLVALGTVAPVLATAWALGTAYDYAGDTVSFTSGLSKDSPSFGKSFGVGGVTAAFTPLGLSASQFGAGVGGKLVSGAFNAGLSGTAAYGASSILSPGQNASLAGGISSTGSAFGSVINATMPGPAGAAMNQLIQVMSGPTQTAIESYGKENKQK